MTNPNHMAEIHIQKPGEAEDAKDQQKGEGLGFNCSPLARKCTLTPIPATFGAPNARQGQSRLNTQLYN